MEIVSVVCIVRSPRKRKNGVPVIKYTADQVFLSPASCPTVNAADYIQFSTVSLGFPGGSDGKASDCNAGDLGSIPGSGRSLGEGNGHPLQLLLPGKFHGWRSLLGYSPWGRKESDTTERLHFHCLTEPSPKTHINIYTCMSLINLYKQGYRNSV